MLEFNPFKKQGPCPFRRRRIEKRNAAIKAREQAAADHLDELWWASRRRASPGSQALQALAECRRRRQSRAAAPEGLAGKSLLVPALAELLDKPGKEQSGRL